MAKLCDDIERFILNLLEEQTQVEIQRNILAARFSCARPRRSITVPTTRFTPVQGFRVESRRGGGGFVRVIRIDRTRVEYMEELRTAIGQELTYAAAVQLLDALCRSGTLAPQQARLMLAAVAVRKLLEDDQNGFAAARPDRGQHAALRRKGGKEHMLCDECGQNQATIHIATVIGGKKKDENLCPQCWQKRNAQILGGLSVGNLLSQLLGAQPQQEEDKSLRCGKCGMTFAEFQKSGSASDARIVTPPLAKI